MESNDLQTAINWLNFGQAIMRAGGGAWTAIKSAAQAHGVEADTAALDADLIDAERRKGLAERDAAGNDTGD